MSDKKGSLDCVILGRSYKVSCAEGERDALAQAVQYIDGKMNEIKESGRVGSTERIAVMVALNIAHELLSTKVGGGFDIASFKRRIDSMHAMLDEALEPQDKLF